MNNLITMMYCRKCGQVEYGSKNQECSFCKFIMTSTGFDKYKWESKRDVEKSEYVNKLLVRIKNNIDFEGKSYTKRLEKEIKEERTLEKRIKFNKRYDYNQRLEQAELEKKAEHQPKCPTCSSTNVSSISGLERGVSVLTLGLFSKKINKSFKCGQCGYTW